MRPSVEFEIPVVRKTSVDPVIPKEKKVDFAHTFQQRSKDNGSRTIPGAPNSGAIWGPIFRDRTHFNEMHFY